MFALSLKSLLMVQSKVERCTASHLFQAFRKFMLGRKSKFILFLERWSHLLLLSPTCHEGVQS